MKYFPQILIGVSALVAIFALVIYFQQTSPDVTDQTSNLLTVVNETPEPAPAPVEEAPQPEEEIQEASLAADGLGINRTSVLMAARLLRVTPCLEAPSI